jgi:hypothetical protein
VALNYEALTKMHPLILSQRAVDTLNRISEENQASMFETKLQMRLQSSEPKCANCSHWNVFPLLIAFPHIGQCQIASPHSVYTTDLQVCSKWRMRDGQQAEETR